MSVSHAPALVRAPWPLWMWVCALAAAVVIDTTAKVWIGPVATWIKGRHGFFDDAAPAGKPPRVSTVETMPLVVAASHGRRYVIAARGLRAVESDGRTAWTFETPHESLEKAPLVAEDGTVYLAGSSNLYALTDGGELKWTSPAADRRGPHTDGRLLTLAQGRDGTLYAGGRGGVWAFAPDGHLKWSSAYNTWALTMLVGDDVIYVGGDEVAAIRASDGSGLWKHSEIVNGPLLARDRDGNIYFGFQRLKALDPNGRERWSHGFERQITGAAIVDDHLIVAAGALYCLSLNGTDIWRFRPPDLILSPPLIARDIVVAGNANILGVDRNGRLLWRVPTPSAAGSRGLTNHPPLLFLDADGSILATQVVNPGGLVTFAIHPGE